MKIGIDTALVLAPHIDDGELGCGATIANLVKKGTEVFYVAFSSCKESWPSGVTEQMIMNEWKSATSELGIKAENLFLLNYSVRYFERDRQEILEDMIKLRKKINPDVVFSPSIHDIHQDHYTIASECMRAFKNRTILQYEVPWNNYNFNNQFLYCVDEGDAEAKCRAIACYESQKHRNYVSATFIKGVLSAHGVQAGVKYAEVFEAPRFVCSN